MVWIRNADKITAKVKTLFTLSLIMAAMYCAIYFSKECSQGVINGLSFCVTVLVPSLFVFMVIASYIANSKIAQVLGKILATPTQKLLGLPDVSATPLILSLIGGYPVGARCVAEMYSNKTISKAQAQKLSMMAVCAGPGFVINYISNALLNNKSAGIVLLLSQIMSFAIVAIICGRGIKADTTCPVKQVTDKNTGFVEAVHSGCVATVNMCAMVIVFSAIISICDRVFAHTPLLRDVITGLLEVTTACNRLSTKYPLYVTSFLTGFGGLSVHFQIFSALKDVGINKFLFFSIRILQGIIAGSITYIFLILFPATTEVFSTVENASGGIASSIWGCGALMLTAVCFLNSISYTKLKRR